MQQFGPRQLQCLRTWDMFSHFEHLLSDNLVWSQTAYMCTLINTCTIHTCIHTQAGQKCGRLRSESDFVVDCDRIHFYSNYMNCCEKKQGQGSIFGRSYLYMNTWNYFLLVRLAVLTLIRTWINIPGMMSLLCWVVDLGFLTIFFVPKHSIAVFRNLHTRYGRGSVYLNQKVSGSMHFVDMRALSISISTFYGWSFVTSRNWLLFSCHFAGSSTRISYLNLLCSSSIHYLSGLCDTETHRIMPLDSVPRTAFGGLARERRVWLKLERERRCLVDLSFVHFTWDHWLRARFLVLDLVGASWWWPRTS